MGCFDETMSLHQNKMRDLEARLIGAIAQLDDDGVNWRPNEESNSIANIVLHIIGNLRQRFVAGVGGALDTRDRDREFASRDNLTKAQLIQMIKDNFQIVHRALEDMSSERLDAVYHIQGEDITGLGTIFGAAVHTSEHVGQALFIAKMRLGQGYQIQWVPKK